MVATHRIPARRRSLSRGCLDFCTIRAANGDVTLWRAGGAAVRARVVTCGAARARARRLHAGDARAVVGRELDPKGPAAAGASALCAGDHSGNLSPAYR